MSQDFVLYGSAGSGSAVVEVGLEWAGLPCQIVSAASARALALRALVFIGANCYAAVSVGDYPERWCAEPDDATCARVRRGAQAHLAQARPGFLATLQRIDSHPRVAPVFARHWPPT